MASQRPSRLAKDVRTQLSILALSSLYARASNLQLNDSDDSVDSLSEADEVVSSNSGASSGESVDEDVAHETVFELTRNRRPSIRRDTA